MLNLLLKKSQKNPVNIKHESLSLKQVRKEKEEKGTEWEEGNIRIPPEKLELLPTLKR